MFNADRSVYDPNDHTPEEVVQFIRDYMFPKSKEDTVSTISDQLGAYREIKERVEDLENRIHLLDEISRQNLHFRRRGRIRSMWNRC
mgnify:CR=1 FL=1